MTRPPLPVLLAAALAVLAGCGGDSDDRAREQVSDPACLPLPAVGARRGRGESLRRLAGRALRKLPLLLGSTAARSRTATW
jgi:hypothetical protein